MGFQKQKESPPILAFTMQKPVAKEVPLPAPLGDSRLKPEKIRILLIPQQRTSEVKGAHEQVLTAVTVPVLILGDSTFVQVSQILKINAK